MLAIWITEAREYLRVDGTCPFRDRFASIADARAKARIDTAIRKLERGLRPGVRSVGGGVHEARIDYRPGYRVYFGNDGESLVILLLTGDKRPQDADILAARSDWADYRTRKRRHEATGGRPAPTPLSRPNNGDA